MSSPKQKLNKKQQELWDEWLLKDKELSAEFDRLNPGQLNNGLVQSQKKLQQQYLKKIREVKHS